MTDYFVIRAAAGVDIEPELDGRWDVMPTTVAPPQLPYPDAGLSVRRLVRTERTETRDYDGATAVVYELQSS
jgi:hypothetical protein